MIAISISLLATGCTNATSSSNQPESGDPGRSPTVSLKMDPISAGEVSRRVTYDIGLEHRKSEQIIAASVINNGSQIIRTVNRPFPENRPFIFDGSIYELSYNILEVESAKKFRMTLSGIEDINQKMNKTQYRDLPNPDKKVLKRHGWDNGGPFKVSEVEVIYDESNISDSVLVPTPEYSVIEWGSGSLAQVTVENADFTQINTYKYISQKINDSVTDFGRSIISKYSFGLEDLPPSQESIILKAIEQGYEVIKGSPPKAFRQLSNRFDREEEVEFVYKSEKSDSSVSGSYIVRYDNQVYWTELFYPGNVS